MEFVKRNYPAEFRAEEASGLIEGVPIVFDSPTDIGGMFQETICRGAIAKGILENDVHFYYNHDLNGKPIARSIIPIEKKGGMVFEITDTGVRMRANPNRQRTDVNDLCLAIEDGTISGMSFMFGVEEERWEDMDTDYPKRFITKISPIVEVSAVNYPAYKATEIHARGNEATDSDLATLERMRHTREALAETHAQEQRELELLKIKAQYLTYGGTRP